MNKMYFKLIAITLTLILSASVVVMSSYAWFVLSANPIATGIQVTIGGGNTILVAPDITKEVDGKIFHHPGRFLDTMNFAQYDSYDYLQQLGGLSPVSTANGVDWFLPTYYGYNDKEVLEGDALPGQLRDFSDFIWDGDLEYANLPAGEKDKIHKGSYAYLDFWVVAPGGDFTLRISTGNDSGGSFVMDLLKPESADTHTGYTLGYSDNYVSSAVRVGFLANPVRLIDDSMLHYQNSIYFDDRFTSLNGMYHEPDTGTAYLDSNRFTIYEPNGNIHPNGTAAEGTYVQTRPVGYVNGVPQEVSVADRLTVQKYSLWLTAKSGVGSEIEQRFQAALMAMNTDGMSLEQIAAEFYGKYLQGQLSPYVDKGEFIRKTTDLYKYGDYATEEELNALEGSDPSVYVGATEDVYIIKLEKNVPQRIRMFIWLEGQDIDCVNAIGAASFAVNIELAGSNLEQQ